MYDNFTQCSARLGDIEAIDFYFARTLCLRLQQDPEFDSVAIETAFYVLLALNAWQRQGDACLLLQDLAGKTLFTKAELPDSGWHFDALPKLKQTVDRLAASSTLCGKIRVVDNRLYSARYWQFEQDIKQGIEARLSYHDLTQTQIQRVSDIWPALFDTTPSDQQDWQQVAAALAINQRFSVVSGGPGTGKTYTIARILLALQAAWDGQLSVMLAAPTGKAAQRLTESIGAALTVLAKHESVARYGATLSHQAITLHRLLGMPRWGVTCRANAARPIQTDVLVVDESSMIDLALMARLFRALPPSTHLILVGDPDQLPSVETGNVLGDVLAAMKQHAGDGVTAVQAKQFTRLCPHLPALNDKLDPSFPVHHYRLLNARRFSGQLAEAADAIREGNSTAFLATLGVKTPIEIDKLNGVLRADLKLLNTQFDTIVKACFDPLIQASSLQHAMQALQQIRWLTPFRQGEFGAIQLNERIELLLSPNKTVGQFYPGKPLMITENQYNLRLFNGDVGIVWPTNNGQLQAWFTGENGELKSVPISRLPQYETVYAMTIHKSQGSEFEKVVLCLPEAPTPQAAAICTRELVYTGLTRAKHGCLVVAETEFITAAINTIQRRKSGLPMVLAPMLGASA